MLISVQSAAFNSRFICAIGIVDVPFWLAIDFDETNEHAYRTKWSGWLNQCYGCQLWSRSNWIRLSAINTQPNDFTFSMNQLEIFINKNNI